MVNFLLQYHSNTSAVYLCIFPDLLHGFTFLIRESGTIAICSHRNPDPDTIGSNLALAVFLKRLGKEVISACIDPLPAACNFLPGAGCMDNTSRLPEADLLISVDASSPEQLGLPDNITGPGKNHPLVVFDHHRTNTGYGTLNIVFPEAAATALIIYRLFMDLGWHHADIATCLLCGLYGDTGSFMHSNTSADCLEASADLLKKGARRDLIIKSLYKNKTPEQLYLWGKIFSEAMLTRNDILVSALKKEDFDKLNTDQQSLAGVIDYLNMVKDSKITALLTEDGSGRIKGSLRTKREDVDLTEIAKSLGGGGHTKASGFTLEGHLKKEIHWKIVP